MRGMEERGWVDQQGFLLVFVWKRREEEQEDAGSRIWLSGWTETGRAVVRPAQECQNPQKNIVQ